MKKVGEILEDARVKKSLTIKDSSKFTKIHEKYLQALEDGNYSIFSDGVHIRGFLRNYASFLGLSSDEILAVWRREYKEETGQVLQGGRLVIYQKLAFTPKFIMSAIVIILILVFSSYLYIQFKDYAGAPPLLIESPEENLVTSTKEIWIKGMSYKNAFVYINGKEAKTTETGSFRFPMTLDSGVNTFTIKASNRLGKDTEVKLNIIYEELEKE